MFKYWRGDGCHGIGYETLCRFIPILHNFFSGNHLLPSNHKETQPFLPAVQRSADGSSNSLKSTQPHTINQAPEQPPYPSRPEKPAREACAACRRGFVGGWQHTPRGRPFHVRPSHKKRTGRHTHRPVHKNLNPRTQSIRSTLYKSYKPSPDPIPQNYSPSIYPDSPAQNP